MRDRIRAAADREGCGVSEWIRFALRRALLAEPAEAQSLATLSGRDDSDCEMVDMDAERLEDFKASNNAEAR
jgi:hypothetical protein